MSNPFITVVHGVDHVAKDVAHGVVDVVEFLPKAVAVLDTAIKDQPEVKKAILDLVTKGSAVLADVGVDVVDKGVNLTADAKTLADAEAFFRYFKSEFIPVVESIYKQIAPEVK